MTSWKKSLSTLIRDTAGQDIIEYALIAGLFVLTAGAAMPTVASGMLNVLTKVQQTLISAGGGVPAGSFGSS